VVFFFYEKIGCSRAIFPPGKLNAPAPFFLWKNWMLPRHFPTGKIEILFHLDPIWHVRHRDDDSPTVNISARKLWSFPFHLDSGYSWYNYSRIFPVSQIGSFSSSGFACSNRASSSGAYSWVCQVFRMYVSLWRAPFWENLCSLDSDSFSRRGSFETSGVSSYRPFRQCARSIYLWIFAWWSDYFLVFLRRHHDLHHSAFGYFPFGLSSLCTPCASASFFTSFPWLLLLLRLRSYRQNWLEFRSQVWVCWLQRGGLCVFFVSWWNRWWLGRGVPPPATELRSIDPRRSGAEW